MPWRAGYVQRTITNPPNPAIKVGNILPGAKIHIQVITTGVTVRFAPRQDTLNTPTPFGGQQGIQFASTDGVVEIVWTEPEIWASGIAGNASQPVIDISGGRLG